MQRKRNPKNTPEYVERIPLEAEIHLIGLACCVYCHRPILYGAWRHATLPRWEDTCTPLREARCTGAMTVFVRSGYNVAS